VKIRREDKSAAWEYVIENIKISAYENVGYCDLMPHNIDEGKILKIIRSQAVG
jgi:hypothetical protein